MIAFPVLFVMLTLSQQTSNVPFDKPIPTIRPSEVRVDAKNAFARVTYEFVRKQDSTYEIPCFNTCERKIHLSHFECSDACDTRCKYLHWDLMSRYKLFGDANQELFSATRQFGIGSAYFVVQSYIAWDASHAFVDQHPVTMQFGSEHFVKEPCSTELRILTLIQFDVVAHVQLIRKSLLPDGSISVVEGPKFDAKVAEFTIPSGKVAYKTIVKCNCAIVMEGHLEEENEKVGGVFMDPDTKDGKNEMQFCNAELQGTVGLTCTADSMTSCTFTATNLTDKEIEICVYPGTEMICSDDKTQNIGTCGTARLVIPPGKAGPFLPSTASVKVRAVCLNMNKKEPDGSSKFKIGGPSSEPLRRLARFSEKERFKSVVEQMRVWIVTDQATLAEMQKHLMFPKPTPGQYLRALETVATVGLEDLTDSKYAKCLDPTLISGAPTTIEALNCFVGSMEKANAQGLSKAASNPKTFDALWTENATKFGAEHAAWVANALGNSSNLALQTASGNFLMNIVPVARREEVALSGGLSAVGSWLLGADEVRAKKSLEILSAYGSKSSLLYLFNPNPMLPEAIRLEAKKLADELLMPPHGTLQGSLQFLYSYNKP
jgi:hypothetical protein